MSKKIFGVLFISALLLGLVTVGSAQTITIGLSVPEAPTEGEGFFVTVIDVMQTTGEAAGVDLMVRAAEFDPATQAADIAELIAAEVSVLMVYPVDPLSIADALAAANEAGIPVVLLGSDVDRVETELETAAVIAADPAAVGEQTAAVFCESMAEGSTVLALSGIAGLDADAELSMDDFRVVELDAQLAAFSQAMAENCAGVTVMVEDTDTYLNVDSLAYLQANLSASLKGVFTSNAELAIQALTAARQARVRGLEIVTLGVTPETLGAIESGRLKGIINITPESLGQLAVETALAVVAGEDVEALVPAELTLVTLEAVNAFRAPPCTGNNC